MLQVGTEVRVSENTTGRNGYVFMVQNFTVLSDEISAKEEAELNRFLSSADVL